MEFAFDLDLSLRLGHFGISFDRQNQHNLRQKSGNRLSKTDKTHNMKMNCQNETVLSPALCIVINLTRITNITLAALEGPMIDIQ